MCRMGWIRGCCSGVAPGGIAPGFRGAHLCRHVAGILAPSARRDAGSSHEPMLFPDESFGVLLVAVEDRLSQRAIVARDGVEAFGRERHVAEGSFERVC